MMLAFHDALRRELGHIARVAAIKTDDPRHVMATAAGWQMFKAYLQVHHGCEDDLLRPVMEKALADRADDLALLAALEAEHAAIDPLLNAVDATLANPASGPERLGDLTDAVATTLTCATRRARAWRLSTRPSPTSSGKSSAGRTPSGSAPKRPACAPGCWTAWTRPRPCTSSPFSPSPCAPPTVTSGWAPTASWTAGAPLREAKKGFRSQMHNVRPHRVVRPRGRL